MKKLIKIAGISLVICLMLTGCSKTSEPEKSVTKFFDAIKDGNLNKANLYFYGKKSSPSKYTSKFQEKLTKKIFSRVEYKILSSKEKGKNATVKVKVKCVDLAQITIDMARDILPKVMAARGKNAYSSEKIQKLEEDYFIKNISKSNAKRVTSKIVIALKKKSDKWKIMKSDDLTNAITGNLLNASKAMQGKFN